MSQKIDEFYDILRSKGLTDEQIEGLRPKVIDKVSIDAYRTFRASSTFFHDF